MQLAIKTDIETLCLPFALRSKSDCGHIAQPKNKLLKVVKHTNLVKQLLFDE